MDNTDSGNTQQLVVPAKYPLVALFVEAIQKYNVTTEAFYQSLLDSETVKVNLKELGKRTAEIAIIVIPATNAFSESIKKKDKMLRELFTHFKAGGKPVIEANKATTATAQDPVDAMKSTIMGKVLGFKRPKYKTQFTDE